jgi:putative sigma-54 modulation protein
VDVTVSSRNVEVTEALRAAATEKIGRLDRFLPGMDHAEVHFFEERNPRISDKDVCEVTLEGHGHHVRAKCAAGDPFAAVDKAVDKLEHQLHKLKTKLVSRSHPKHRAPVPAATNGTVAAVDGGGADDLVLDPGTDGVDGEDAGIRIVRTKAFEMKPMTPEEAALHLELLGHGFYFFANAETGRTAVVYRRSAGDVGLIDAAG